MSDKYSCSGGGANQYIVITSKAAFYYAMLGAYITTLHYVFKALGV